MRETRVVELTTLKDEELTLRPIEDALLMDLLAEELE
jgi:hypothetical protein